MLLRQLRPGQVSFWTEAHFRCMCTSVESSAKNVRNQKETYIKQMAENQSEARPAEWDTAKPYNEMPGPKPIPILGNIWTFLPGIGPYYGLDQLAQQERLNKDFGKIVKISDLKLRADIVFCFDPNDIETCYRNEGVWPHREGLQSLVYYKLKIRDDIFQGQGGVLTSHGEKWYNTRSVVNQPMMQPRSAQMYIGSMDDVAQEFIERMRFLETKHPQGEMPEDFGNELNKWSLESICIIGLNKRLGLLNPNLSPEEGAQKFINNVLDMFQSFKELDVELSFWRWFSTPAWKRLVKTLDSVTDFQIKHVNEAMKKMEESKIEKSQADMSILEQLLKKDKKIAIAMVFDMLTAGIDTTSKTAAAALYYLCTNQKAQEKLRQECISVLPKKDSPITKEALNNMPYLKAVVKETTRLAPIAIGNIRRTPKDLVLSGYQIPKGTDILCSHLLLCKQDKYFPRANEFIPDRWLRQGGEKYQSKDAHPFVYMPFGFGPRSCIGKRLALLELEVVIAKIIRNFVLTWPHEEMKWTIELLYGTGSPLKYHIKSVRE